MPVPFAEYLCLFAISGGHLKRVTVVLPLELHKLLKLKSVNEDRTMNDLILTAVRKYISECGSEKTPT